MFIIVCGRACFVEFQILKINNWDLDIIEIQSKDNENGIELLPLLIQHYDPISTSFNKGICHGMNDS